MGEYYPPTRGAKAFHCPRCRVYAKQDWERVMRMRGPGQSDVSVFGMSICSHCGEPSYWFNKQLVDPDNSFGLPPLPEMPEEVRDDYEEARAIAQRSPRSAAALLRLALQKLMPAVGGKGKHLDTDIKRLVGKGLPVEIQQSLDSLRVIGNNAVHPGELDLRDDLATVASLLEIMNYVVDRMVLQPAKIAEIYARLPGGALEGITKRDGTPNEAVPTEGP